jgi:hypothetical protein
MHHFLILSPETLSRSYYNPAELLPPKAGRSVRVYADCRNPQLFGLIIAVGLPYSIKLYRKQLSRSVNLPLRPLC